MHPNTPTRHHPAQPEPVAGEEDAAPNPTQLPVEPEFGTMRPPTEPDDPSGIQPPR